MLQTYTNLFTKSSQGVKGILTYWREQKKTPDKTPEFTKNEMIGCAIFPGNTPAALLHLA